MATDDLTDPILALLMAELNCPFPPGTPDATAWLIGYGMGHKAAAALAWPDPKDRPPIATFEAPPSRRDRAN